MATLSEHTRRRMIKAAIENGLQIATVEFDMPEGEHVHVPYVCGPETPADELIEAARLEFPVGYEPEDAISPPRVRRRAATIDDIEVA